MNVKPVGGAAVAMFAGTEGRTKPWNVFCMFVVLLTEAVCMLLSVLVFYFCFDVLCYDK